LRYTPLKGCNKKIIATSVRLWATYPMLNFTRLRISKGPERAYRNRNGLGKRKKKEGPGAFFCDLL
jgi:hypothetical protein